MKCAFRFKYVGALFLLKGNLNLHVRISRSTARVQISLQEPQSFTAACNQLSSNEGGWDQKCRGALASNGSPRHGGHASSPGYCGSNLSGVNDNHHKETGDRKSDNKRDEDDEVDNDDALRVEVVMKAAMDPKTRHSYNLSIGRFIIFLERYKKLAPR